MANGIVRDTTFIRSISNGIRRVTNSLHLYTTKTEESGRQKYLISCTAKQGKPSFPTKPGHGTSHNGQDPECLPSIQIVSSENNAASPANSSEDAPGKSRRYTQYLLNFVLMGFRRPERSHEDQQYFTPTSPLPENQTSSGPPNPSANLEATTNTSAPTLLDTRELELPDLTKAVTVSASTSYYDGTYATVFKTRCKEEIVAMKEIRIVRNGKEIREKYQHDLSVWKRLDHPNVLRLLGFVQPKREEEFGGLVTDWCENGSLARSLSSYSSDDQRLQMIKDVARGMKYLHAQKPPIVHGDLRPANVLLDKYSNCKLCDFGPIRLIQGEIDSDAITATARSGAPRHLSYELVVHDGEPTPESDIYALGCLILEIALGIHPYAHISNGQRNAYYKICREIEDQHPPATRPDVANDIQNAFWDLLEKCWDHKPESRPTAAAVEDFFAGKSPDFMQALRRATSE